ncbi:hypothetical protein ACTFIW_012127 [Dictyostelium discoideum]
MKELKLPTMKHFSVKSIFMSSMDELEWKKKLVEKKIRYNRRNILKLFINTFVTDPSGKDRFVLDYRAVNDQTIEFAFTMSNADAILEKTKNSKYFSKIDCKKYTAFRVGNKLYQFKRACFGLKNSPAYFNKWIQDTMDEFEMFAAAYVYDIIIFSDTIDEQIKHINALLEKFKRNNIYLSIKKCKFFESEIEFVGHTLTSNGIKVKDSKVNAIINLPEPTTVKQDRAFVGTCNYYKRFIRNFTNLTFRLTELTKSKTKKVTIDEETRKDISELKKALTSTPLLLKPNHDKKFKV